MSTLAPSETAHRHQSLRYALGVNYAGMICLALSVNLMPVLLTSLQRDLGGLTNEQLGRIGSVMFVGLVIGIITTGPLADRHGAKFFASGGNVLIAVGLALVALRPTYETLLAAVCLMGIGAGALDTALSPITVALQPGNSASALNWLHSFYCIGAVLTVVVATLAIGNGFTCSSLSLAFVPLPFLLALAFFRIQLPPLVSPDQSRSRLRQLVRIPFLWVMLLAIFFAGATELGIAQWLPAYVQLSLHFSKTSGGIALAAFSVAMGAGRITAGFYGGRSSSKSLILIGCYGCIATLTLASFAFAPHVALAGCIGTGLACSVLWPSILALTAEKFPHGGASVFAMLAACGNAGGIVAPWCIGEISEFSSLHIALLFALVYPIFLMLCIEIGRRFAS